MTEFKELAWDLGDLLPSLALALTSSRILDVISPFCILVGPAIK